MAAAYHMEALRKQRVINRAQEARARLQPELAKEDDPLEKYYNRERPISGDGYLRYPSPPAAEGDRGKPVSVEGKRTWSRSSRTPSSRSTSSQDGSRHSCRSASRSTTPRSTSKMSASLEEEELSEEEIARRDLQKKEKMLRDSNLVMGHISPKDIVVEMV